VLDIATDGEASRIEIEGAASASMLAQATGGPSPEEQAEILRAERLAADGGQ
jgi:hypothetical protein